MKTISTPLLYIVNIGIALKCAGQICLLDKKLPVIEIGFPHNLYQTPKSICNLKGSHKRMATCYQFHLNYAL